MNLPGVARTDKILDELGGRLECSASDDEVVAALAAWVEQIDGVPSSRAGRHRPTRGRRLRRFLGGGAVVVATFSGASVAAALVGAEVPALSAFGRVVVELVPGEHLVAQSSTGGEQQGVDVSTVADLSGAVRGGPVHGGADGAPVTDATTPAQPSRERDARSTTPGSEASGEEGSGALGEEEASGEVSSDPAAWQARSSFDRAHPALAVDIEQKNPGVHGLHTAPGQQKKTSSQPRPAVPDRVLPGAGWVGEDLVEVPDARSSEDTHPPAAATAPGRLRAAAAGRPELPPGLAGQPPGLAGQPPGLAGRAVAAGVRDRTVADVPTSGPTRPGRPPATGRPEQPPAAVAAPPEAPAAGPSTGPQAPPTRSTGQPPAKPGTGTATPEKPADTGTGMPEEPVDTGSATPAKPADTGTATPEKPADTGTATPEKPADTGSATPEEPAESGTGTPEPTTPPAEGTGPQDVGPQGSPSEDVSQPGAGEEEVTTPPEGPTDEDTDTPAP